MTSPEASTERRLLVASLAFVGVLLSGGFAGGWLASRHLTAALPYAALERLPLGDPGDAPPSVRAQILQALALLQDGYTRRDLKQLPDLMRRVFARDRDVVALGTDSSEWVSGYDKVEDFIRADWANWGDVRLAVDHARVASNNDTAWVATVGIVTFHTAYRATSQSIRFTAVMSRVEDRWVFRQLEFARSADATSFFGLMRPETFGRLHLQ